MRRIELSLSCSFTTAVEPTQRVCEVASMFGLGVDRERTIAVVPQMVLPIAGGTVVFVTGASGGGKSTLLRLIGDRVRKRKGVRKVEFGRKWGKRKADSGGSIVEAIGGTLEQAVRWLALAGLNDAFVMLRRPCELSDGQRYRFALARAMAETEKDKGTKGRRDEEKEDAEVLTVVLADEFGSTLDRMTAKVVARNVRKWVNRVGTPGSPGSPGSPESSVELDDSHGQARRGGVCFIAATTHDDLLEYLDPDVLVVQEPGEEIAVHLRERQGE